MKLGKEAVSSYVTLKSSKHLMVSTSWVTVLIANAYHGSLGLLGQSKG